MLAAYVSCLVCMACEPLAIVLHDSTAKAYGLMLYRPSGIWR
jgi:hypothetical protein